MFISTAVRSQQVEKITEINYYGSNGLNPSNLTVFNSKLYFLGTDDQQYVDKLMFTDGTEAGVSVVKQIDSIQHYPSLRHLTMINNLLVFNNFHQLWKSDGTTTGTSLIKKITISAANNVVMNNKIYFAGDTTNSNPVKDQLWQTDRTSIGTRLVKAINPSGGSYISNMTVCGGKIYFSAYVVEGSYAVPWVSDGTAAGIMKLKEIASQYGANSSGFTAYNDKVYFSAIDNASGLQLWVTDGTTAATSKVTNINPGDIGLSPGTFTPFNSKLFLMGLDKGSLYQLWSTDGTTTGTIAVKTDYTPRTYSGFLPQSMAVFSNKLYMSGHDSLTATIQLWVSDGITAGTTKVTNFAHGLHPDKLYAFQNRLIMTGYDSISKAAELFASHGTAAGIVCPKPSSNGVDVFYPWEAWVPFNNAIYYKAAYGYFADYQLCRYTEKHSSGIKECSNQNLKVYSNPSYGTFEVVLPPSIHNSCIEVYNNSGALIHKQEAINAVNTIDLNHQSPGIYFIKVNRDTRIIGSQKIVIQ